MRDVGAGRRGEVVKGKGDERKKTNVSAEDGGSVTGEQSQSVKNRM